jgi:uncharacterized protein YgiM (DUF1202 family)
MRSRMLLLIALVLTLAVASACVSSRVSRLPLGTPVPSKTLRPTFTPTTEKPTLEPTPTAAPVEITSPTPLIEDKPTESSTEAPTPTEAPAAAQFTVNSATLNVRGGPGTNYAAIGRLTRGETRDITGKNAAGDWWEFDFDGRKGWVSGSLVTATAGGDVQVAANIPAPPTPRPTARPVARPTAQPQQPQPQPQTQPPPAASTIFGSGSVVLVRDANPPFEPLTFWARLGPTSGQPISGYSLKVSAPSGERIMPFGAFWERAYSGYPDMEFLQNVKVEVPRTAGAFRAVVVDGSGTEVSDAITGTVTDSTHDVVLGWQKR